MITILGIILLWFSILYIIIIVLLVRILNKEYKVEINENVFKSILNQQKQIRKLVNTINEKLPTFFP